VVAVNPGVEAALMEARARVLHDLTVTACDTAPCVDVLDDAVAARRRWLEPWPDGADYVACLVAQDVQEGLLTRVGRWPTCPYHDGHALHVEPDLGADPRWVCVDQGAVAEIGRL
jgi:hypothetical protein